MNHKELAKQTIKAVKLVKTEERKRIVITKKRCVGPSENIIKDVMGYSFAELMKSIPVAGSALPIVQDIVKPFFDIKKPPPQKSGSKTEVK